MDMMISYCGNLQNTAAYRGTLFLAVPNINQDKHFEQDSWRLLQKCDLWSVKKSPFDLAWWPSFWPQVTQFQTWPRIHQDKHFEQDSWCLFKKVTSKVLTRFSFDLARWPSFWSQVTKFRTWPGNHQQTFWAIFMMITSKYRLNFDEADMARTPPTTPPPPPTPTKKKRYLFQVK